VEQRVLVEDTDIDSGRLRILTMHRPEARNAMDTAMLTELVEAVDEAEGDPGVRGLLLAGTAGAFSAGADVREPSDDGHRRRMELFTVFYERLTSFRRPTAAAIEGPAVGGGAEAAAACDLRVAARGTRLRFPGAVYGIPVGVARTVGQVGLSVAKDWVLSSRDVDAEEAHRVGFVQRLVEPGQAVPVALEWLEQTAGRDPDTVALLKRLFNDHGGLHDRVAFENDALRAQAETGRLPPGLDRDLPRTVRPRRR
jgi:enoyl-CoA hydratase